MKVRVSLFANLRAYSPNSEGSFDLDLTSGATVADLLEKLRIPPTVQTVILINGRRAEAASLLALSDEVTLFPPMEGG
jgi:molybdopterin converting factor small subunit